MTIEQTFRDMLCRLRELQETLDALGTTVDEDKPRKDDVVVASILSDAVLAGRGFLEEALQAAEEAHRALLDGTRRALIRCQKQFHRFAAHFASELGSCDRIDDLRNVGRERGQEWLNWVTVVKQVLERCRELLEEARNALFLCWQELTERMSVTSVSVCTTNIGQQFSARESIREMPEQDGVT
ncbi:MAG: hypothetical protein ACR2KT_00940 [Methylocella sp.]|nr:MAG: hypothetical protein DLM68_07050 [Hyphomicrobiales bacterium]